MSPRKYGHDPMRTKAIAPFRGGRFSLPGAEAELPAASARLMRRATGPIPARRTTTDATPTPTSGSRALRRHSRRAEEVCLATAAYRLTRSRGDEASGAISAWGFCVSGGGSDGAGRVEGAGDERSGRAQERTQADEGRERRVRPPVVHRHRGSS